MEGDMGHMACGLEFHSQYIRCRISSKKFIRIKVWAMEGLQIMRGVRVGYSVRTVLWWIFEGLDLRSTPVHHGAWLVIAVRHFGLPGCEFVRSPNEKCRVCTQVLLKACRTCRACPLTMRLASCHKRAHYNTRLR